MGQSASKEKFRESVTALIQVDVSADDADFWDELWKIPSSAEEVFETWPRYLRRQWRNCVKLSKRPTIFISIKRSIVYASSRECSPFYWKKVCLSHVLIE
jgi:hypothetical protein